MRALQEKTGIHWVSICRYERGKTIPSTKNLIRLAAALGCTVEDLIAEPKEHTA